METPLRYSKDSSWLLTYYNWRATIPTPKTHRSQTQISSDTAICNAADQHREKRVINQLSATDPPHIPPLVDTSRLFPPKGSKVSAQQLTRKTI